MIRHMAGRLTVLALAIVAGVIVATIDAQPLWRLGVLACLAWAVYIVFILRGKRVHE